MLLALAAAEGAKVIKTDTKQAYLYGDMGDDVVYIRPPWPDQFRKDTYSSYSREFMERGRWHVNGTIISQHGWKTMDMRQ